MEFWESLAKSNPPDKPAEAHNTSSAEASSGVSMVEQLTPSSSYSGASLDMLLNTPRESSRTLSRAEDQYRSTQKQVSDKASSAAVSNSALTTAAMEAMAAAEKAQKAKVAAEQDAKTRRLRSEETMEKSASAQAAAEIAMASKVEDDKAMAMAVNNFKKVLSKSQGAYAEAKKAEAERDAAEKNTKYLMTMRTGYAAKAEAAKQAAHQAAQEKAQQEAVIKSITEAMHADISEMEQSDTELVEKARMKQKASDAAREAKDNLAAAARELRGAETHMSFDMIEQQEADIFNSSMTNAAASKQKAENLAARRYAELMGDVKMVEALSSLRQQAAERKAMAANAKDDAARSLNEAQKYLGDNNTVLEVWEQKEERFRTLAQTAQAEESAAVERAIRLQKEADAAIKRAAQAKLEMEAAHNKSVVQTAILAGVKKDAHEAKLVQEMASESVQDKTTGYRTAAAILQQSKDALARLDVEMFRAQNTTDEARRLDDMARQKVHRAADTLDVSRNMTHKAVLKRMRIKLSELTQAAEFAQSEQRRTEMDEASYRTNRDASQAKLKQQMDEKTVADKKHEERVSANEKAEMLALAAKSDVDAVSTRVDEAQKELKLKVDIETDTSKRLAMARAALDKAMESRDEAVKTDQAKATVAKAAADKAARSKADADDAAAALAKAEKVLVSTTVADETAAEKAAAASAALHSNQATTNGDAERLEF